jgi:hypothetical protein
VTALGDLVAGFLDLIEPFEAEEAERREREAAALRKAEVTA